MASPTFIISFPQFSTAEANRLAGGLADSLREVDPDLTVDRIRSRDDSQDFGASLAIILGTASATAVARGIAAWLARQPGPASIDISRDGKVRATGLDSKDAARIAEAFKKSE